MTSTSTELTDILASRGTPDAATTGRPEAAEDGADEGSP